MGLKADIVKALQVSLDKDDSEHLAKEIMDRLPPVYAAAPEMLESLRKALVDLVEHLPEDMWTVHLDRDIRDAAVAAIRKAEGQVVAK